MRILKNATLAARWQRTSGAGPGGAGAGPDERSGEPSSGDGNPEASWDRELAKLVLPPRLSALVLGTGLSPAKGRNVEVFDIAQYVDAASPSSSPSDGDRIFLLAVKAALTLAARLEPEGAFRVLVRRHDHSAGSTVTLRCFRRDDSHPKTPDELDEPGSSDCVLFVDTRRIDGARRAG